MKKLEVEGSKEISKERIEKLKKLANEKDYTEMIKHFSNQAIYAEKAGELEDAKKMVRRIEIIKKLMKD